MKRAALGLMSILTLAAVAMAADATGSWSGTFSIENSSESRSGYAVLKQTGASLTGTAGPDSGEQWPIENGKAEGNKIAFSVRAPDGEVFKLQLVVDGDAAIGDITAVVGDQNVKGKIRFSRVK